MNSAQPSITKKYLTAILEHIADGVIVQDPAAEIVYINPAAASLLGFATAQAALTAGRDHILGQFHLFDEHGQPLPVDKLPGREALRGHTNPTRIIRARTNSSGPATVRWAWIKATSIQDAQSQIEYVVTTFQEITHLKNAELRLADTNQRIINLLEQTLKLDPPRYPQKDF